jgi:hypothetical protein
MKGNGPCLAMLAAVPFGSPCSSTGVIMYDIDAMRQPDSLSRRSDLATPSVHWTVGAETGGAPASQKAKKPFHTAISLAAGDLPSTLHGLYPA